MSLKGGCHCGAVRYEISETPERHGLCHCTDCRLSAGAPMVGWMIAEEGQVTIQGETREYKSSEHGRRYFCPTCGTGLFYRNDVIFAGLIDVQSATLDEPDAVPAQAHIQIADRIAWMETAHELPTFDRYPAE